MPLMDGPPSPTTLSRCEDEAEPSLRALKKPSRLSRTRPGTDADADMDGAAQPMSPRVRKRLDEAMENANVFGRVCEQGEVIQWMSACHSGLIEFGRDLERRGFTTLSSIAFLTEEDIDESIDPGIRLLLLSTLARLRHEFFRM